MFGKFIIYLRMIIYIPETILRQEMIKMSRQNGKSYEDMKRIRLSEMWLISLIFVRFVVTTNRNK